MEYQYKKNAQMAHTGRYGGSKHWQGTVIIENGDLYGKYGKCRLFDVFHFGRRIKMDFAVSFAVHGHDFNSLDMRYSYSH